MKIRTGRAAIMGPKGWSKAHRYYHPLPAGAPALCGMGAPLPDEDGPRVYWDPPDVEDCKLCLRAEAND